MNDFQRKVVETGYPLRHLHYTVFGLDNPGLFFISPSFGKKGLVYHVRNEKKEKKLEQESTCRKRST